MFLNITRRARLLAERIELPAVAYGPSGRQIIWKLPGYPTLHQILTHPVYSGTYTYGRTKTIARLDNGRKRLSQGCRLEQKDWQVLLIEHHEGYITWDEYQSNQALITHNANMKGNIVREAVKRGGALLVGLLRCGHCARKLHVAYSGTHADVGRYTCRGDQVNPNRTHCIAFGGWRADELVSQEVLRHLEPLGIQASLEALERARLAGDERIHQKELALEQARYEVARARSQYDAVDPLNRLVAAELERRWNEALKVQSAFELELQALRQSPGNELTPAAREELMRLGQDLPRLWNHPASSPEIKKRILRTVLKEICCLRSR